jgi:hypothetical protein
VHGQAPTGVGYCPLCSAPLAEQVVDDRVRPVCTCAAAAWPHIPKPGLAQNPGYVVIDRRHHKQQAVYAVEHTAMPRNQVGKVLDPHLALNH